MLGINTLFPIDDPNINYKAEKLSDFSKFNSIIDYNDLNSL